MDNECSLMSNQVLTDIISSINKLHYVIFYFVLSFIGSVLRYAMFCYAILCCTMQRIFLCYATLCIVILSCVRCAIPCCTMLYVMLSPVII